MTVRLKGWQNRFVRLVDQELEKPFDWVTANCGDLVACSVIACHGPEHPILQLLGKYTNQEEVEQLLKSWGGLHGIFGKYFEKVHPAFAQQADIVVMTLEDTDVEIAGVVADGVAMFRPAREGAWRRNIVRLPLDDKVKVYRV